MASKTSAQEYEELGRRYYKLKQYAKAIEVLSQGIDETPTLVLYDYRAATYDKLNDLNAAIKDGREMIKMDKKEVKGYLRTASVLEKMEKLDTALGIYRYGMKNVPVNDANFKILQQMHDRTTRKLSPAIAVDPFTVMPAELVAMILEYVSFRQMVSCMRVSRGWRNYLSNMPKLWLHLDLSGARRPVPRSFVAAAVKRAESRVTSLTIHRFEHADMLTRMAKVCKSLTDIEITSLPYAMSTTLIDMVKSAPSLRKLAIHPEITADTAKQIMESRPELQHVAFHRTAWKRRAEYGPTTTFSNLITFAMHSPDAMLLHVPGLLRRSPALESLVLTRAADFQIPPDMNPLPPLTTLIIRKATFSTFPHLPPTLHRLVIDLDRPIPASGLLLPSRLPHLLHLSLSGFSNLSGETTAHLLDRPPTPDAHPVRLPAQEEEEDPPTATPLVSLSLRGTLDPTHSAHGLFKTPTSLFTTSPRVLTPALTDLDLATLPCDDDEIEALLAHHHHPMRIHTIDLSDTSITGAAIKMLADGLPTLRAIRADRCARINGRDAIAYAERKGIVVSCAMAQANGGRKVRYG